MIGSLHCLPDGNEFHLDYPVRFWPRSLPPFDPNDFEEELGGALRALATGDRALAINTRVPLHATTLAWWREEGGQRVTFGSDAHESPALAAGLADGAAWLRLMTSAPTQGLRRPGSLRSSALPALGPLASHSRSGRKESSGCGPRRVGLH